MSNSTKIAIMLQLHDMEFEKRKPKVVDEIKIDTPWASIECASANQYRICFTPPEWVSNNANETRQGTIYISMKGIVGDFENENFKIKIQKQEGSLFTDFTLPNIKDKDLSRKYYAAKIYRVDEDSQDGDKYNARSFMQRLTPGETLEADSQKMHLHKEFWILELFIADTPQNLLFSIANF